MYKTKTISYDTRVRTLWTLAAICVLAFGIYLYSVNMTIRNTVARQELEAVVTQLSAETSALEFEYIAKKNDIKIELAQAHGLSESKNPIYVSRTRSSGLTLHTPAR